MKWVKANKNWYNLIMDQLDTSSSDKPVAYDANGQPLYLHPQEAHRQEGTKPQAVHITRSADPEKPVISEEIKLKNQRSKQTYPDLNLSENEYVIISVKRHFIGLLPPFLLGVTLIFFGLIALINYKQIAISFEADVNTIEPLAVILPIILFILLVVLVMYIVYYIFSRNKFFLTNESIIQEIQISLFSKRFQTVSLSNVEETSYAQSSIVQQIFDYGSLRLSTIGDENMYRFTYAVDPKKQIDILNNAVEAFKNGRPVEE